MNGKYHRISRGKDENGKRIFIDEHRLVMEEHLGRKLKRNEVVHHINGDKSDNRIENLQLMTLSEHSKMHGQIKEFTLEHRQNISKALKHRPSSNRTKTKEDIIKIVNKYIELKSYRKVDRYFGLSNGMTGNIIRGKKYYDFQDIIKEKLKNIKK